MSCLGPPHLRILATPLPRVAGSPQHRTSATIWSAPPPSSLHNYLVLPPFRELIRGKRAHLAARSSEFVAAVHRNMTARYQVKSLRSCRVAALQGHVDDRGCFAASEYPMQNLTDGRHGTRHACSSTGSEWLETWSWR